MYENGLFFLASVIVTFASIFGLINYKILKLPSSIGLVVVALTCSIFIILVDIIFPDLNIAKSARSAFLKIDFHDLVMKGALCFLLFAGALHVDLQQLLQRKYAILSLATIGVLISTFLTGLIIYYVVKLIGLNLSFPFALLFGALISPTDPVAVLGLLKSIKSVPESLKIKIAGESLFNDGVGIVIFSVILTYALASLGISNNEINFLSISEFFIIEAIGGIILGLASGYIAYLAIKTTDDFALEIMITLSLVMITYWIALKIHVSGPLAVVIAGIIIGNYGTKLGMSDVTRKHVNIFWLVIDEILNAGLFLLIGLEILAIELTSINIVAGLLAIPIVLLSRFISVSIPITLLKLKKDFSKGAIPLLTWGGMKGAISVALALSIPDIPERDPILAMTYGVVIFSIIFQGLTIKKLVNIVSK
ncbi:MAG: sodium:proton antiporter [Rhodospirillaceae bacterium]|nr:sodium:proton antiporter [Rhodospirillaceae bacterium]|tara:strand:- start:1248 stop:2513 length:1266 start_codon:yes stop_codon:yes gene_type:complete